MSNWTPAAHDLSDQLAHLIYPASEWRDVVGFEGLYIVSVRGEVARVAPWTAGKNQHRQPGGLIKAWTKKTGYSTVVLYKDGQRRDCLVHRIVAEAFLGSADGREVNHRDCVRSNNHLDNLEYVSKKENAAHAISMGRYAGHLRGADGRFRSKSYANS